MFGKHFQSTYTGSMYGAGIHVFAVWGYVIAHTVRSQVELNPKLLAGTLGTTPELVQQAIDYLCAPDPASRNKSNDGRRLIREGEYAYLVPSWDHYHGIINENDRREYNREKQRESRARKSSRVKQTVNDSQHSSAPVSTRQHSSAEAEAEAEAEAVNPSAGVETFRAAPSGLDAFSYSRGLLEQNHIVHDRATIDACAQSIKIIAEETKSGLPEAADKLGALLHEAIAAGERITRFWFLNGKFKPKPQKEPAKPKSISLAEAHRAAVAEARNG